jgi:predicted phage tail component-like protein
MLNNGFTFNAVRKDYLLAIKKRRQYWAPIRRNFLTITGSPGALLDSTETDVRVIPVEVEVSAESAEDLRKVSEDFAEWLITTEPKELVFDDEKDRIYYAVIEGTFNPEEIISNGYGTINFICPDPCKYGQLKSITPVTNLSAPIIIQNNGTAETAPTFTFTLKQPTTYLDIIGDKDYMRIGQPANIEETPIAPKQVVLQDGLETTTGWANAQSSDIDGGVVAGVMLSNGYQFYATDYGVSDSWHGPAKIKSIGQSLTDFEAEVTLTLKNEDYKKHGRVELYLLDSSKLAVCKLSLKDISQGQDGNYTELRIGDSLNNHFIINERGNSWDYWVNFEGILRISRVGNKWTAYVAKFDANKNHINTRNVEWTDVANQFTRNPTSVVVHIGAHGTIATNTMSTSEIKVSKINNPSASQVPQIGVAGDVFTFDHKTSKILKNGEVFTKKDFGARFFKLQKGNNTLVFNPPEVIEEVKAEWRDAYL